MCAACYYEAVYVWDSNQWPTPEYLSHPQGSLSQYILRGSPFKTDSTPLYKAEGLVLLAPERRSAMLLQKQQKKK